MEKIVLVVDDDDDVRMSAQFLLSRHGYKVIEQETPEAALQYLKSNKVGLILLDMNFTRDTTSGSEGLDFLEQLNTKKIDLPVIVMTAWPTVNVAVEAMKIGAKDFLEKPWNNNRLLQVVKLQFEINGLREQNLKLKQQNTELRSSDGLVWKSNQMMELIEQINRVAPSDASILLLGENGTGKSCIAQYIHNKSARSGEKFVSVNMGALPQNLFESELFGHVKGAFTDANSDRIGRFELAEKGTLFLDEVSTIPLENQPKLLRVLESGEYEKVGSSKTLKSNVRVICASNGDFSKLIEQKHFRQDLYYRLNTVILRVPNLEERQDDILPLAHFFLDKFSVKYGRSNISFSDAVKQKLLSYAWPGNVRELSHIIERAVIFCSDDCIKEEDILQEVTRSKENLPIMPLEQAEVILIKQALRRVDGNVAAAAEMLEISASALYRRMEKHDIKTR